MRLMDNEHTVGILINMVLTGIQVCPIAFAFFHFHWLYCQTLCRCVIIYARIRLVLIVLMVCFFCYVCVFKCITIAPVITLGAVTKLGRRGGILESLCLCLPMCPGFAQNHSAICRQTWYGGASFWIRMLWFFSVLIRMLPTVSRLQWWFI